MIYQVKGISGHQWVCVGCVRVCAGVCGCVRVCRGVRECVCECVHGCVQVWEGVHGYARVCTGVRGYAWVWDVFSEFLLENRVPTSEDFNTFPIRIFFLYLDGEMDDDGFFMGELNGRRGLVPSNFLTDVPPGYIFVDQSPHVIRSSTSNQPRILGTQRRW